MSMRSWRRAAARFFRLFREGTAGSAGSETEAGKTSVPPGQPQPAAGGSNGGAGQREHPPAAKSRATPALPQAWHCWFKGCDLSIPMPQDDRDAVGFCQVHHLVKHHGLKPEAVVEAEPGLAEAVRAYCEEMGLER